MNINYEKIYFTIPNITIEEAKEFLGIEKKEFEEINGLSGYRKGLKWKNIKFYFDNPTKYNIWFPLNADGIKDLKEIGINIINRIIEYGKREELEINHIHITKYIDDNIKNLPEIKYKEAIFSSNEKKIIAGTASNSIVITQSTKKKIKSKIRITIRIEDKEACKAFLNKMKSKNIEEVFEYYFNRYKK